MTADAGIHGHDPACDCKQCVTAQRELLRLAMMAHNATSSPAAKQSGGMNG